MKWVRCKLNPLKRLLVPALLLLLAAGACSPQAEVHESTPPSNTYHTNQRATYHVGIATIGYGQAEDEMSGAEALVQDYGDAKYGGVIKHIVLPDNFAQEQATIIREIVALADDPLMKAIIVNPAVGGTAEAFQLIREKREDILLFAGGPQDDPALITAVADIVVDQDFISRGYYDILRAEQMGASTFVHMSFPRHMDIDQIFRRKEIYESVCNDLGIKFVAVTTPDPAGEIGVAGAQQAVYDMIPQLIDQYGPDTVFFTTNTAQHEPIIKRVMEYGALFVSTDDASPLVGYPTALGLDLSENTGDWNTIVDKIEQAVVDQGMSGRMGIFAYSLTYCHSRALGRLAVDMIEGNITGDRMVDIANAYKSLTPGCEWQAGWYREASTGREIENFYTLSQDTYILGQGYSGVMNDPSPNRGMLILLASGLAILGIAAGALYIKKRRSVPQDEPAAASDLSQFKLTAREIEIIRLLAAGQSTAQIARALFISEKTVRVHISNMLSKTQSESRVELIILAKQELSPGFPGSEDFEVLR